MDGGAPARPLRVVVTTSDPDGSRESTLSVIDGIVRNFWTMVDKYPDSGGHSGSVHPTGPLRAMPSTQRPRYLSDNCSIADVLYQLYVVQAAGRRSVIWAESAPRCPRRRRHLHRAGLTRGRTSGARCCTRHGQLTRSVRRSRSHRSRTESGRSARTFRVRSVWHSCPVGKERRARRPERESQFTRALRLFRGSRRIFFEAGFALNIIVSLVKGLMP